jgi:hypothetical protein
MQSPGRLPLDGDRWTPFVRTLQFEGIDFTGATFAMQVRDRKDGGALRADLETVDSGSSEGVRLIYGGTATVDEHIEADRIDEIPQGMSGDDDLTLSLVGIRINESTMEAMTPATEIGADATAYWDLHVTPSGGLKDLYLFGPFTIRAGVTE